MDRKLEKAKKWFLRASHDFETAQALFKQNGYPEIIIFLLHQAVEKYLKGYLIATGWKLRKIHDLVELILEASSRNKSFAQFEDFCRRINDYYTFCRYPSDIEEFPKKDFKEFLAKAEELIKLIQRSAEIRD